MAKERTAAKCRWLGLSEALTAFVSNTSGTQGSEHIKPLHWYVACRLVIEGGFHPDDIRPRPPFETTRKGDRWFLEYSEHSADGHERTVLGGLKTKNIDVVVSKDGIGPVIAVSMKGTLNAFRNLTNRMEEAVGDCTNLHLAYPALVYGFLHVLRAVREEQGVEKGDVAITRTGNISEGILRYHDVMARLSGRNDVRDVTTKYEAVTICLADPRSGFVGTLVGDFPPNDSLLRFEQFFERLYQQYDQRFLYAAPKLSKTTRRIEWDPESPVVTDPRIVGYAPRIRYQSASGGDDDTT